MVNFDLKEAVKVANQAISAREKRSLTDVEMIVLEGSWDRLDYDQIAARHQYATSYLCQDVAPKLWKALSEALGEKVKKSNFKEALKRRWEQQLHAEQQTPAFIGATDRNLAEAIPKLHRSFPEVAKPLLSPDFYIERPPIESVFYATLLRPSSLVRVKAPKLMGKTMLINQALAQVGMAGFRTVNLSLELADRRTHLTNLDKFLRWLCLNLTRELKLPNHVDEYWDEAGMGSKVSCTTFVEEFLLESDDRPLVICLDDVDLLFPHPEVYEDFFGLLRSWHEKARSREAWRNLRLVISHATDVYIRLNINQSPFNVGLPINLPEFTPDQVHAFAQHYGLSWSSQAASTQPISLLMEMVGGHPYLLEQAFSHLKVHSEDALPALLAEAPTDIGIYSSHLREHWINLQQRPELVEVLKQIVSAPEPIQVEPMQIYPLQSMGLVIVSGKGAEPRCNLYRQYFQKRLGVT
jgi:hypothetical protein